MTTTFPQTILIIIIVIIVIFCVIRLFVGAVRCLFPVVLTIIGILGVLFVIAFLIQLAS